MSSPSHELTLELASQVGRARHLGIEFLHAELEMARAFLDLAETFKNGAISRRNLDHAAKALDAVGKFTRRLNPQLPQRQLLSRRARQLRGRLAEVNLRQNSHSIPERRNHPERSSIVAVRDEHPHAHKPLRELNAHDGGSHSS